MKTKILLIAIVYYFTVAISGCIWCKCDDPNRNFVYSGLETAINTCEISDTAYQYTPLYTDSLPKDALGIILDLNGTIVFSEPEEKPAGSFINTAYACKCPQAAFLTVDTLLSIAITTLQDFDNTHTAGADVTGYFKVLEYDYSSGSRKITQSPAMSYFQYANGSYSPGFYLPMYMAQFPQYEGYAQFRIKAFFKNGKEFETVTQKVYLY